jgi:hypothetical protein
MTMDVKRRIPAFVLASTVLATTALAGATGVAAQDLRTYSITITNLVSGQPLTPPVIAAHDGQTSVLVGGAAASEGVKELAENGNNRGRPRVDR